jgi:hypothetical protein
MTTNITVVRLRDERANSIISEGLERTGLRNAADYIVLLLRKFGPGFNSEFSSPGTCAACHGVHRPANFASAPQEVPAVADVAGVVESQAEGLPSMFDML